MRPCSSTLLILILTVLMTKNSFCDLEEELPELGIEEKIRILEWAVEEGLSEPLINTSGHPIELEKIDFSKLKEWTSHCHTKIDKEGVKGVKSFDDEEKCHKLVGEAFQTVTQLSIQHLAEYLEMRAKAKEEAEKKKDEL